MVLNVSAIQSDLASAEVSEVVAAIPQVLSTAEKLENSLAMVATCVFTDALAGVDVTPGWCSHVVKSPMFEAIEQMAESSYQKVKKAGADAEGFKGIRGMLMLIASLTRGCRISQKMHDENYEYDNIQAKNLYNEMQCVFAKESRLAWVKLMSYVKGCLAEALSPCTHPV